jgi:hypothetical protein
VRISAQKQTTSLSTAGRHHYARCVMSAFWHRQTVGQTHTYNMARVGRRGEAVVAQVGRGARTVPGRSETSVRRDRCRACGMAGEERAARSLKWTCGVQSARREENRLAARWTWSAMDVAGRARAGHWTD